ncbi:MAG: hypothetical protein M0R66_03900 [Candidatus Omnitrophica bacterium]|nr:hypothetical protein [Candidatus Omnitrophota bacterium]
MNRPKLLIIAPYSFDSQTAYAVRVGKKVYRELKERDDFEKVVLLHGVVTKASFNIYVERLDPDVVIYMGHASANGLRGSFISMLDKSNVDVLFGRTFICFSCETAAFLEQFKDDVEMCVVANGDEMWPEDDEDKLAGVLAAVALRYAKGDSAASNAGFLKMHLKYENSGVWAYGVVNRTVIDDVKSRPRSNFGNAVASSFFLPLVVAAAAPIVEEVGKMAYKKGKEYYDEKKAEKGGK